MKQRLHTAADETSKIRLVYKNCNKSLPEILLKIFWIWLLSLIKYNSKYIFSNRQGVLNLVTCMTTKYFNNITLLLYV